MLELGGKSANVLLPDADLDMRAHDGPLVVREPSRFEQDGVGNADLADVVQQSRPVEVFQFLFTETTLRANGRMLVTRLLSRH